MKAVSLVAFAMPALVAAEDADSLSLIQTKAKVLVAERSFDSSASQMRTRHDNKCIDYNYNNHNVYMHGCHEGANQKWYLQDEKLKTTYNNLCLDMSNDGNVYMHACHGGTNQQWYFEGENLKVRASADKCLDYHSGNNNIYMYNCHAGKNQMFYFRSPPNPALASRVKSRHGEKCLDYNYNDGNIYFHPCHNGGNQKWYLDGTALKSLHDNKCADYNANNNNVYMHGCHEGKNQQWNFGANDKMHTNYDSKCLDMHMENFNIYMHACHGGNNQKFYMENSLEGLDHDEVEDEVESERVSTCQCKSWCSNGKKHKNKPWCSTDTKAGKCQWQACSGCSECSGCSSC